MNASADNLERGRSPLISLERLVDTVPVSRNENLAGFMHKCGICEERSSGYDKVIAATCDNGLVAPIVQSQGDRFTKVALFSHIPFELTTKEDRIRTCYGGADPKLSDAQTRK